MILRLLLLGSLSLFAQFDPGSAKVVIYVPQLADGGDATQRWQTTLQLMNSSTFVSNCTLDFLTPGGQSLAMDFGMGASSRVTVQVPPGGRVTLRSAGTSPQIRTGWARGFCTYPVVVNTLFRMIDRGRDSVEIAASAATLSPMYRSAANRDLGIAIANAYTNAAIGVSVEAFDNQGRSAGRRELTICPSCQTTGNLGTWLPNLPPNFEGTVLLSGSTASSYFVAWTLHSERGLLAPLPEGALTWPVSQQDRIWELWMRLLNAAIRTFPDASLETARLNIGFEPVVNAFARSTHEVTINLALAQLISDSPSELASVIAHEIAHLVQFRRGRNLLHPDNRELDADAVATLLLLQSGFDPYAGAGALGKLMMVSRRSDLLAQSFDDLASPHTSFSNRIGEQMALLDVVCALPDFRALCAQYKQLIHPNFPSSLPLANPKPDVPAAPLNR